MLRLLMMLMVCFPAICFSDTPKYKEPDRNAIQEQQTAIDQALKQAETIQQDGTLDKLLIQEQGKLKALPSNMPGLNIKMPEYLEKERDDRYLAKALAAGKSINSQTESAESAKYPIALISLSMPESQIKSLIAEAYQIGAAIVVRGLIDDDFQKTLIKLKQLAGEMDGGVLIDPTLFQRFSVDVAPTFVLPLEPLELCTDAGCPTPKHVKASGSATFQYFLDLVERSGSDKEKAEARQWLAKYGDK